MKFGFIAAKRAEHTVSILCRCLRVTRSGFYGWLRRPASTHAQADGQLRVLVRASFEASAQRYGSPRIYKDLAEQDVHVSRKRVARLMQEEGLKARPRKRGKGTTMSDHDQPIAPNLLDQQFGIDPMEAARRCSWRAWRHGPTGRRVTRFVTQPLRDTLFYGDRWASMGVRSAGGKSLTVIIFIVLRRTW